MSDRSISVLYCLCKHVYLCAAHLVMCVLNSVGKMPETVRDNVFVVLYSDLKMVQRKRKKQTALTACHDILHNFSHS